MDSYKKAEHFPYTLLNKIQYLSKCLDFQMFHEGIVSFAAKKTESLVLCLHHAAITTEGGGDRGVKNADRQLPGQL